MGGVGGPIRCDFQAFWRSPFRAESKLKTPFKGVLSTTSEQVVSWCNSKAGQRSFEDSHSEHKQNYYSDGLHLIVAMAVASNPIAFFWVAKVGEIC